MAGSFFNIARKAAAGITKSSEMVAKGRKSAVGFLSKPSSRNGVYDMGIKAFPLTVGGSVVSSTISMKGSEESIQRIAKLNKLSEFSQQVDKMGVLMDKSFNKASEANIRERLFNPNVMESVSAQNALNKFNENSTYSDDFLRKYRAQKKTNSKMSKYYEKKKTTAHVIKEAELNKTFSGQEKESLIKKSVKKSIDELELRKKAKASGFIGSDGRFVVPKKYEKRFKDGYVDKYGQRTDKSNKRISDYLLERQNRPINNSAKKTAEDMSKATKGVAGEVTEAKGFFKGIGKHKGKLGIAAAVVGTAVAMNAMTPKYDIPLDNLPASQRKQKLQDLMEIQKNMQSGVY